MMALTTPCMPAHVHCPLPTAHCPPPHCRRQAASSRGPFPPISTNDTMPFNMPQGTDDWWQWQSRGKRVPCHPSIHPSIHIPCPRGHGSPPPAQRAGCIRRGGTAFHSVIFIYFFSFLFSFFVFVFILVPCLVGTLKTVPTNSVPAARDMFDNAVQLGCQSCIELARQRESILKT